ncbi:MAG: putative glycosyltransferase [Candidatus Saccharibacteria bacterium]|nr:putative glycosyltransferase [Candidatus Saccharibacteria bacterium]
MVRPTTLKVSVVIPCYNEESSIALCLQALQSQTIKPFEVIVVDNNCTDNTVKIAKEYGATVIKEDHQGIVWARNAGFNAASGSILAKLDADSLPAADWVERMQKIFINQEIQAATGTGYFYDAPCKLIVRTYRNLFAVWLNRLVLGHHMLWGSNMTLRAGAWRAIGSECCQMRDIMEDLDVAAHINTHYGNRAIVYRPKMRVDISSRRAMVSLKRNWLYLSMWPRTLSIHGYQKRIILWPAIAILLTTMALSNKVGRFYNAEEGRMVFSFNQWRSNPFYTRDNP